MVEPFFTSGSACVYTGPCAYHAFLIAQGGKLFAVGLNNHGQLGLGDMRNRGVPEEVDVGDGAILDVACGHQHTFVRVASGEIYAFGRNASGQLGLGFKGEDAMVPQLLSYFMEKGEDIVSIFCGESSSYCVGASGRVWSFGSNERGRIGDGLPPHVTSPAQMPFPEGVRIVNGSAGWYHVAAISEDGVIYTWGDNGDGQLGRGGDRSIPVPVDLTALLGTSGSRVRMSEVVCGAFHVVALSDSGDVFGWGNNYFGQLGVGNITDQPRAVRPSKINNLSESGMKLKWLRVGGYHAIYLTEEIEQGEDNPGGGKKKRQLFTYGRNDEYQLCLGTTVYKATPIEVGSDILNVLEGADVEDVGCGCLHSILVTSIGDSYGCGESDSFASVEDVSLPVRIMRGVAVGMYRDLLREALVGYAIAEQKAKENQQTVDASLTIIPSSGGEIVVRVNSEFIKARFARNVKRLELDGLKNTTPIRENELLELLYGEEYVKDSLGAVCTMTEAMKKLYEEKDDRGDVVLIGSSGESHRIHRFILVARREYFKAKARRGWSSKELDVDIPLGKPFETYLHYLYTGELLVTPEDVSGVIRCIETFSDGGMEDAWLKMRCEKTATKRKSVCAVS